MDARVEAAAEAIWEYRKGRDPANVNSLDLARIALAAADAIDPVRASHARLLEACKAAQAIGVKAYHIGNAHEAPMDWAKVKTLLDAAIAAAEEGGDGR